MSHTTEHMKEVSKTIAQLITEQGKSFGVSECYTDDFGKFGNFQLVCRLDLKKGSGRKTAFKPNNVHTFSLLKIVYLIKRIVKDHSSKGATLRCHESPQGVYTSNACGGMRFKPSFEGYERNYIMIDIDFIPYHAESNSFAVQQTELNFDRQRLDGENQLSLFL